MSNSDGALRASSVAGAQRSRKKRFSLLLLLALCVGLFTSLGIWQVYRLGWKLELIDAVNARAHGAAEAIPAVGSWNDIDVDELEYQRVTLTGTFNHDAEVQTLAVTELGSGFWVITPLLLADALTTAGNGENPGSVLINRGFVPQDLKDPASRSALPPTGQLTITGLLRASEPDGGFLRSNDPENNRWFSRDTAAIGSAQLLSTTVAPFFVDAELQGAEADETLQVIDGTLVEPDEGVAYPRAGMTVIAFRNSHLIYALTWFALALMSCFGIYLTFRDRHRIK